MLEQLRKGKHHLFFFKNTLKEPGSNQPDYNIVVGQVVEPFNNDPAPPIPGDDDLPF
jgi:hypothetical protein